MEMRRRIARLLAPFLAPLQERLYRMRMARFSGLCAELGCCLMPPWIVKVGANDGVTGDPFSGLLRENQRWHALFVEPVPFCVERLKANFPDSERFIIESVAVGKDREQRSFFYVDPRAKTDMPDLPPHFDQLGSFSRAHIARHFNGRLEPYILSATVECRRLSDILDAHGIFQPALLHIDTEGSDLEVLRSIDFQRHKPCLVFAEHKHLSRLDRRAMFRLLRAAGYTVRRCGGDCLAVDVDLVDSLRDLARRAKGSAGEIS